MQLGYARVSTDDQDTRLQTDALERAGCKRIFREKASGAKADRPELARLLETLREGDMLVVWVAVASHRACRRTREAEGGPALTHRQHRHHHGERPNVFSHHGSTRAIRA